MQKKFNVTGICIPEKHYMVDISNKINQIRKLVDNKNYFTINRARQYGKTTTLNELKKVLENEYTVVSMSFQGLGDKSFENEEEFCLMFMQKMKWTLEKIENERVYAEKWLNPEVKSFKSLDPHITDMCCTKKIILIIDEVDKTSNNRVFLGFIDMLREKFLERESGNDYTFHSVILAGVNDIKNIKLKLINDGLHIPHESENRIYNSPWNIAVKFNVDMSFRPQEIAGMLSDYERDFNTGMCIEEIAHEIYNYTSGYPFLVSRICQAIDEELAKEWTLEGVQKAVKIILKEHNTLFDDMFSKIHNHQELKTLLYDICFLGIDIDFNTLDIYINLGFMFGFLKEVDGKTKVANKIFELLIYNFFVVQEMRAPTIPPKTGILRYEVIENGHFNMEICMKKFAEHYHEIVSKHDVEFLERHGRLLFLTYIKPLINGSGFFNIEPEISDFRMDMTVEYAKEQFIVELKVWHGEKYEELARSQLANYLDLKCKNEGYILTFDFSKSHANRKAEWIEYNGKRIFEVIV